MKRINTILFAIVCLFAFSGIASAIQNWQGYSIDDFVGTRERQELGRVYQGTQYLGKTAMSTHIDTRAINFMQREGIATTPQWLVSPAQQPEQADASMLGYAAFRKIMRADGTQSLAFVNQLPRNTIGAVENVVQDYYRFGSPAFGLSKERTLELTMIANMKELGADRLKYGDFAKSWQQLVDPNGNFRLQNRSVASEIALESAWSKGVLHGQDTGKLIRIFTNENPVSTQTAKNFLWAARLAGQHGWGLSETMVAFREVLDNKDGRFGSCYNNDNSAFSSKKKQMDEVGQEDGKYSIPEKVRTLRDAVRAGVESRFFADARKCMLMIYFPQDWTKGKIQKAFTNVDWNGLASKGTCSVSSAAINNTADQAAGAISAAESNTDGENIDTILGTQGTQDEAIDPNAIPTATPPAN